MAKQRGGAVMMSVMAKSGGGEGKVFSELQKAGGKI